MQLHRKIICYGYILKRCHVKRLNQENLDVISGGYRCEEHHNCYLSDEIREALRRQAACSSFRHPLIPWNQDNDCSSLRRIHLVY